MSKSTTELINPERFVTAINSQLVDNKRYFLEFEKQQLPLNPITGDYKNILFSILYLKDRWSQNSLFNNFKGRQSSNFGDMLVQQRELYEDGELIIVVERMQLSLNRALYLNDGTVIDPFLIDLMVDYDIEKGLSSIKTRERKNILLGILTQYQESSNILMSIFPDRYFLTSLR